MFLNLQRIFKSTNNIEQSFYIPLEDPLVSNFLHSFSAAWINLCRHVAKLFKLFTMPRTTFLRLEIYFKWQVTVFFSFLFLVIGSISKQHSLGKCLRNVEYRSHQECICTFSRASVSLFLNLILKYIIFRANWWQVKQE